METERLSLQNLMLMRPVPLAVEPADWGTCQESEKVSRRSTINVSLKNGDQPRWQERCMRDDVQC